PESTYESVEKIVGRAGELGDRSGYLVLAVMAKADKDPERVIRYLKKVDPGTLDGGTLLTYSMLFVYLSKAGMKEKEEKFVLLAIKYLKKYVDFKRRDDNSTLKIARLYIRISKYKEAEEVVEKLLQKKNLPFIEKKAAMRLRKKIESLSGGGLTSLVTPLGQERSSLRSVFV
ncbi:MAG: hypothetical protein ACE5FU_07595, partial [Nitrospinota bacterium]